MVTISNDYSNQDVFIYMFILHRAHCVLLRANSCSSSSVFGYVPHPYKLFCRYNIILSPTSLIRCVHVLSHHIIQRTTANFFYDLARIDVYIFGGIENLLETYPICTLQLDWRDSCYNFNGGGPALPLPSYSTVLYSIIRSSALVFTILLSYLC